MKKLLLTLIASFALTGCWVTNPVKPLPPTVAIKYKYIFVTVADEFLEIPAKVPNLDTTKATDKEAAQWILDKEERTRNLETKLKTIKSNQDTKLNEIKTDMKIPKEDVIVK